MECICASHTLRSSLAPCFVENCDEGTDLSEAMIFLEHFCRIADDLRTGDQTGTGSEGSAPTGTPDPEGIISSIDNIFSSLTGTGRSSTGTSAEPSVSSSSEGDPPQTSNTPPSKSGDDVGGPDTNPSSGGGGGLSTGAKAGISIGAVLGAVLLALSIYLIAKRVQRANAAKRRGVSPPPQPRVGELGIDGEKRGWRPPVEVSAVTGPTELQAGYPSTHYEMEVPPAELAADPWRGHRNG